MESLSFCGAASRIWYGCIRCHLRLDDSGASSFLIIRSYICYLALTPEQADWLTTTLWRRRFLILNTMSEKNELESPPVELVDPSEQDTPAVRGHVPFKVWLVQGLYFLERAAFYGLSQPLRVFPCV